MYKRFRLTVVTLLCAVSLLSYASAVTSKDVDRQQIEAQVSFFNQALSGLGANSPEQAVMLWAKGDQSRNGVFKYAAACEALKKDFIKKWGPPEKSFWIIGASSPWLTKYTVIDKNEISPTEVKYTVEYEWATSAGPENPSTEQLWIKKMDNYWCVTRVVQSKGYHSY